MPFSHYVQVKLQLQLQRSTADREFRGPIHCARRIVQSQGVFGLWSGFGGSLLFRSNFMWMFMGYEVLSCSLLVVCFSASINFETTLFLFFLQILMRSFGNLKGTRLEVRNMPDNSTRFPTYNIRRLAKDSPHSCPAV